MMCLGQFFSSFTPVPVFTGIKSASVRVYCMCETLLIPKSRASISWICACISSSSGRAPGPGIWNTVKPFFICLSPLGSLPWVTAWTALEVFCMCRRMKSKGRDELLPPVGLLGGGPSNDSTKHSLLIIRAYTEGELDCWYPRRKSLRCCTLYFKLKGRRVPVFIRPIVLGFHCLKFIISNFY